MQYFFLEPEVAGELGEDTVIDPTVHPPRVDKLHYKFSGWQGDAVLESFPCVIATQAASDALLQNGVTGVQFVEVEVSASDEFRDLYPNRELPPFRWLKISGEPGKHDFGIAGDLRLVVSEKVLGILRSFGLEHALTEPFA
ncbi:hypothetical protein B0G57_1087 [Trinickia symbiotica]|uniref:Uncharacterized protein n=1 Tax=Trinickia symbiotica TaxID=863227 RepID=A0A2N7X2W3_9BURK|nr:hypothetical protein [Trinickia symbiotica]PMS35921.1 hypothetical protein C0Z20_16510 [Trinickia symbiotica]PPK44427.1 hypothetical protein B0G57_1087 [Trinickia symbiotica]